MVSPMQIIGYYLIADGVLSFFLFKNGASGLEQFFRILRALIGIYLVMKHGK